MPHLGCSTSRLALAKRRGHKVPEATPEVRVQLRQSQMAEEATPPQLSCKQLPFHTAGELQDGVPMHPPFPATSGTGVGFGDNAIVGQGVAIHLLQRTSKHFLVPMHPPFPATSGTGVGFGDNAIVGQGVAIHLLQRTSKHFLAARSCSDGLGLVRVRNCPKVHGGACILELTGGRPQVGELVNGISLTFTLLFRAVCF